MPKIPVWIFIVLAVLYLSAVRVDIMDIDASQYAEMSREMMESGDYLHLYDRGRDYLDKPPFLFWASAVSMKIFGVNNFGYKLPSILFALLALYATYRLTKLLYDEATGRMAALVLGTCQGLFLMTNDIRTDTILMSCVVTSLWMIKEAEINRRWYYVLGGCTAIAVGMMTKGPIALLVPLFCFGSDWVLKRNWKMLFSPHHLVDMCIIVILLIPMSIGLYEQFDMHPEKTINDLQGVSGLKFFFWSQSFGRITGESPWSNGAGFDFLFSNMLWSFLPWVFLFVPALLVSIIQVFKQRFKLSHEQEWISTGGFILSYVALGSSKYQLPHYIFVAFPLAAIMVARLLRDFFLLNLHTKLYAFMKPFQIVISGLLLVAALLTLTVVFNAGVMGISLWGMAFILWIYIITHKHLQYKLFWSSVSAIILANIFLTHHFYYQLLSYQVGTQVGRYISAENIKRSDILYYRITDPLNALHFHAQAAISDDTSKIAKGKYVLTDDNGLDALQQNYEISMLKKGTYFKVSELTPEFLNPITRPKAVKNYYFLQLN